MRRRRRVTLFSLTVVLAGCGLGELDDYPPLTVWDNFRIIADGQAYRSAQLDSTTLELVIEQYGIRTIINLRGEDDDALWYKRERTVAAEHGVTLVDIPMSAGRLPPRASLLRLYDTYRSAEYPILIHCKGGADRTGAAAAIWRMVMQGAPREIAALELSPLYGHFAAAQPAMDRLVQIFEPRREWIETEYPAAP